MKKNVSLRAENLARRKVRGKRLRPALQISRHARIGEGYLVTFDFSKRRMTSSNCETQLDSIEPLWIEWNGKRIFEVIV